jgi:gluconate 5-dehydrogenase
MVFSRLKKEDAIGSYSQILEIDSPEPSPPVPGVNRLQQAAAYRYILSQLGVGERLRGGTVFRMPDFSLSGRVAVVTGASRGIGRALAGALAAAGATVALLARDQDRLARTQGEFTAEGYRAAAFPLDVEQRSDIEPVFDAIDQRLGSIDILVNNAGTEQLCASSHVEEALWDRIIDTNLKGAFFCAQAAAGRMRRGGAILNLCSLTSAVGVPGAAAYGASKSGLAGLTRTLATEWAARGIRVNGLGPGYFRTDLTEAFYADERWQARMLEKIPLRRFGDLNDLTGPAVFLCSSAAQYITGQILYVDGGYLASI